jgi:long-chain fatty acid transport protein
MAGSWHHGLCLTMLWLTWTAPGLAEADTFETFGAGARSQGMAGSLGAEAQGHEGIYHNPAGLVSGRARLSLGVYGSYDRTSVLLMERPSGYDPLGYEDRLNKRQDTSEYGSSGGLLLGGTISPIEDKFTLGVVIALPFAGAVRIDTHFDDEREQYFTNQLHYTRLGKNSRRESIGFGMAYRFQSWISMGVGLMVMPEIVTVNQVYTPNAVKPETAYLNISTSNGLREALVVGLRVDPNVHVSIGVTVQDEIGFGLSGKSEIQINGTTGTEAIEQPINLSDGYHPPRVALALAGRLSNGTVLNLETVWMGWARFRDHHAAVGGFDDVLEFRAGLEMPVSDGSFVRFGGAWKPTPVPDQTGRTNYVDNDRLLLSTGGGQRFAWFGQVFQIDAAVQFHGLMARTVHKTTLGEGESLTPCADSVRTLCDEFPDPGSGAIQSVRQQSVGLQTGNPGFPGFSYGGYIVHASLDLQWLF